MPKFTTRPVTIEAVRMMAAFEVETLEGTMQGKAGDWLITGIAGEQYPCDDTIFRGSYVPAKMTWDEWNSAKEGPPESGRNRDGDEGEES